MCSPDETADTSAATHTDDLDPDDGPPHRQAPEGKCPPARPARTIAFLAVAVTVAVWVHFHTPNFHDRDDFYHFRHAALYATHGIGMLDFPWLTCSVIRVHAADLWYGFHLLLLPFTLAVDDVVGMKLAGAFLLGALLALLYLAMRRGHVALPALWPFLLLFSGPLVLWRMAMLRPQALSTGLLPLLLVFAAGGSVAGVLLVSLAISSLHLTMSLYALATLMVVVPVRRVVERRWDWRTLAAGLVGILLGWILRPNPLGAAKLLYIQTVVWAEAKRNAILLDFGRETAPISWGMLFTDLTPLLLLWLAAIGLFVVALRRRRLPPPGRHLTLLWSSFILSVLSFQGMVGLATRFVDLWAGFGVLFIAGSATRWVAKESRDAEPFLGHKARRIAVGLGACLIGGTMLATGVRDARASHLGRQPGRLRAVAGWLKEHSRPGDVVFHVRWWDFPELFFWNQQNRYISGMDPIFQYSYDPALYWKVYLLEARLADRVTCATPDPDKAVMEDTYAVLRGDFHASYIYVETSEFPGLAAWMRSDPRFILRFEEDDQAVFEPREPPEPLPN